MHSKHGALDTAVALFTQSNQRSVVTWNLLLRAYARQGGHGHVVLHLFQQMQQEGVMPNRVTYVCILSALVNHPAQTVDGKHMHACIQASKFRSDVVVGTAIFNMYGRCGSLQSAWEVFDDMPMRDVVAWNAMIAVYAHQGLCKEALHMFGKMLEEGLLIPNKTTYVNVLAACANQAGLDHGRQMHNHIQDSMCDVDVMVATALVNMYGKCSSIEDAWRTFLRMPERNVITWNVMIFLFAQQSQSQKALELHYQMQNEGVLPDSLTFVSLFAACTSEATLAEGDRLLTSTLTSGLEMDVVLGNSIINMYGKCGSLERAQRALETMPEQNVITWTTIITAYTHNNHGKLALELYYLMQQAGIRPNQVTLISVLDACASHGKLVEGKLMHACIMDDGYEGEIAVRNSLISMYGKCGSLPDAQAIFHKMIERDIVSWNAMIVVHSCQGEVTEAFQLFIQMQKILIMPNLFTFVSMLDMCSRVLALVEGKQIHAYVIDGGFESQTILGTALINMYSKCGMLEDACKAFDMILEQNVVSWTALITAYAQLGQGKQAIELFDQMQEKGVKPNNVTFISILSSFSNTKALVEAEQMCNRILNCGLDSDIMVGNTLVTLYGKCGSIDSARMAFDKMHERDLISWNSMMAVYAQHGCLEEAFQLLEQMHWEGLTPDRVTFLTVIDACSKQLALDEGKRFHCCIAEMECKQDVVLGTSVMSMYGKCGSVNDALKVFSSMPEHDVVSWTVIIAVCAQNGQAKEAIQLFHQMQQEGVTPNEVTFSNVINACSHAGLFHDGLACFTSMVETYSISPDVDHYVSMIDLLGRAGQIHQADNLISDMPFQPTTLPYMTLLGACRQPVGVLQGEQAAVQAMELDPDNPASYVVLSNIHATLGNGGR